MKEEDLMKISIELRRTLYGELQKFWQEHKGLNMQHVFFINSTVISSLIAQIVFTLFKKDIGIEHQCDYIDQICEFSKKMLEDGKLLIASEISFQ